MEKAGGNIVALLLSKRQDGENGIDGKRRLNKQTWGHDDVSSAHLQKPVRVRSKCQSQSIKKLTH